MADEKPTEIKPEDVEKLQADLKSAMEALDEQNDELERYKAKHKEAEKHLKEKERLAKEATEEAARKSGDVEALEKSLHEKYANDISERDAKIAEQDSIISKMTVGSEAQRLAADLAVPGSAEVLLPHIERRLQVEIRDGTPSIRVLDKDGKPSASSVEDLRKELEGNASFAPLIIGSKASGSGAPGGKGFAGNTDEIMKMKPVDRMNAGRNNT